MEEVQSSYKWCVVPKCKSTSIKHPGKVFITVPKDEKIRKKWLQAARRDPKGVSIKTVCFVCEDHFDLQNDLENYVKWKLVGGRKLLKKDVIPHRFDCQADRKRSFTSIPRQTAVKKGRLETIQAAEKDVSLKEELNIQVEKHFDEPTPSTSLDMSNRREIGVQTNIKPHYRSKLIQCELSKIPVSDSASSPFISKYQIDSATSQIKSIDFQKAPRKKLNFNTEWSSASTDTESSSSYSVSISSLEISDSSDKVSSETKYESELKSTEMSKIALQHTHYIISKNIRGYLGMPKECAFLIDLLQKYTSLNITNIYLTLKKIRLSQTFAELGDDFGILESAASRIFSSSVLVISEVMQDLIIWPSSDLIKRNLPIAFRARYSNVQTIIYCLEIEIQKPSDAVKQALTWSEYKKANTLKYLVSSTPDGIINFVSVGYGGRTSDALIVEKCGFLDKLHPGMSIMADRGFKHIDALLINKSCTLVRPPSVETGTKMSEEQVLETKRIASLRIHIERVIRRIRVQIFKTTLLYRLKINTIHRRNYCYSVWYNKHTTAINKKT